MQDYIAQEQVKIACNQAKSADNNNHGPSGSRGAKQLRNSKSIQSH